MSISVQSVGALESSNRPPGSPTQNAIYWARVVSKLVKPRLYLSPFPLRPHMTRMFSFIVRLVRGGI